MLLWLLPPTKPDNSPNQMPDYFLICSVHQVNIEGSQEPKIKHSSWTKARESFNTVHCLVSSVACNSNLMHSSTCSLASSISCSPQEKSKKGPKLAISPGSTSCSRWKLDSIASHPYASCWSLRTQDEADTFELDGQDLHKIVATTPGLTVQRWWLIVTLVASRQLRGMSSCPVAVVSLNLLALCYGRTRCTATVTGQTATSEAVRHAMIICFRIISTLFIPKSPSHC
jgi:hypothetical protein